METRLSIEGIPHLHNHCLRMMTDASLLGPGTRPIKSITVMGMMPKISKDRFEELYRQYNHREFVHPDPLEFLYHYEDFCDREIVAFVASSLAYGRVAHILKSVSLVLERMKPTPSVFLKRSPLKTMCQTFSGFRHRFTNDQKLCAMLFGVKKVIERHGSLQACFSAGLNDDDNTILPALSAFTRELIVCADDNLDHLVPSPTKAFRTISPADPVRYDFSLTRLGIRKDADMAAFLKQLS